MNSVRLTVTISNCKQLRRGRFSLSRRKMCSYIQSSKEGKGLFSTIQQGQRRMELNNRKM